MNHYMSDLMRLGVFSFVAFSFAITTACSSGESSDSNNPATDSTATTDTVADAPQPIQLNEEAKRLTDFARFIAGLEPHDSASFSALRQTDSWKNHKNFNDTIWARLDQEQLLQVRDWADSELAEVRKTSRDVFYPFSGPDFLYGHVMYPHGNYYILTGLEPVGHVPDLNKLAMNRLDPALRALQISLNDILRMSFFKTKDMAVDLKYNELKGTIPVIMLFMARTGHDILSVEDVRITKTGELLIVDEATPDSIVKNWIPGARIRFVDHNGIEEKQLFYFSLHLEDGVLPTTPEFNRFVESRGKYVSYLKGASYLMHKSYFSTIRNLILDNSNAILEDDSGIAYRYFDKNQWNLSFYGNYVGPIPLFYEHYQQDLAQAYKDDPNVKPLEFGLGYQYQVSRSNLMLATRK